MIKWIYSNFFLENKEILFIISIIVILIIIFLTFYFVGKELKNENKWFT